MEEPPLQQPQPSQKEKKGFWGGLLRRASLGGKKKPSTRESRRASEQDGAAIRREKRHTVPNDESARLRRRPTKRHTDADQPAHETEWETEPEPARPRKSRGKQPAEANGGHRTPSPAPLTRWPPNGVGPHEELSPRQAESWICRGVPIHKGVKRGVPHMPERYFMLYATTTGNRSGGGDAVDLHDSMAQLMTMRMQSPRQDASYPWETLEQPSYAFYYGRLPGTITLTQWVSTASVRPPTIALRDSGVLPRPMTLERIFERLRELLRGGLEDDDPDLLYRILYKRILRDPERILNPHRTLDKQITDLILVLSRPDWIDLTNPRNQVVTRFIFECGGCEEEEVVEEEERQQTQQQKQQGKKQGKQQHEERYRKFFHQLLLSLELELRIQSRQHGDWAKEKLLMQIPPSIQWNLALARRWRQNVRVDAFGKTSDQITLRYKLKKRQVRMLRRFAQMMKWPNLGETLDNLKQRDEDFALDTISSDAFAYFSGLVVPGPTFPFLIMNTLIDLDPDPATDDLALLSHMHPHCGFQYRSSYTYWSASCIVGKVLAPTCHAVAGWVGPARPTPDLGRSQIARIRTRRPRQRLKPEDVDSMAERSEPLGPPADYYPVGDYVLEVPDSTTDDAVVDTVRVELLGLRAAATAVGEGERLNGPRIFDATLQFAVDGVSWPLRLMYDVSFITAWPCSEGPHPLFFDYVYRRIRVDEIMEVRNWGGLYGRGKDDLYRRDGDGSRNEDDEERVLVVQTFGVSDNEVLARAWCAHWGLSAVVADIRKTCMACAVREAYAATLTVVILIDDQQYDYDDDYDE
ncbi:hypothetical protein ACRE_045160 [Hapsidospora chrysogenum ATCC 11550]|uniref:Uncharacterized protein n=1 Tax=Hapsidospora chrysogenum (strain ATCC 11550 / CBS 779.69 / DSM 880 / IAM 14645 / JCM 23072 / IMI 49137) TaxID=857340 RepID=A0A086T5N8_HAPC1|nr:hypothetical protein ACRE_045160 [Hapsidospora chrysogenum ATCC 11550]